MPTDAEIRAWLQDAGEPVSTRGPLKQVHRDRYAELSGPDAAAAASPPLPAAAAPDTSYDGGVTDADFGDDPPAPPAADPAMAEQTPGRVPGQRSRATRAKPAAKNVVSLFRGKQGTGTGKGAAGKGKHAAGPARVSTASTIGSLLSQIAWSARSIPPLQRVLYAEAAMAGPIAEKATAGTGLDRVLLQPLARNWERFEVADALIGVPLAATMIALFGRAQTTPQQLPTGEVVQVPQMDERTGLPVFDGRTEAMVIGLRSSLRSWLKMAQANADQILEEAEQQSELDGQVEALVAWILAPPDLQRRSGGQIMGEAVDLLTGRDPAPSNTTMSGEPREDTRTQAWTPPDSPPAPPSAYTAQETITANLEQAARRAAAPVPATGTKS